MLPRQAAAQGTGFALDRFEPAERGSQLFVNDTLDLRGEMRPALGATLAYAYKSLAVYDDQGVEHGAIVRHQLFTHASGSLVLGDRVRFGLSLPVAVYQDGEEARIDGAIERPPEHAAPGDLRLAVDVRVLGRHDDALTLAAGLRTWIPTGSRAQFTGDGSTRLGPQLLAAGTTGLFTYAGRIAILYRPRDDAYAGSPLGSELATSLAAGLRTAGGALVVGPEVSASTVFTDRAAFLAPRGTPAEWLFGVHYDALGLRLGAGVGGGISRGYGAPQLRALLSIEYVAPLEAAAAPVPPVVEPPRVPAVPVPDDDHRDGDGDGIEDPLDACPDEPGAKNADLSRNGCPDPAPEDTRETSPP